MPYWYLFCGKPGHKVPDFPTKANCAKGWASTSTTTTTPAQGKDSTTESKKQWAIHLFQHRRWIVWRPPVLRKLLIYVQLNLQFLVPFLFMFPFHIIWIFLLILFLIVVLLIAFWTNILLVPIIFLSLQFLWWSLGFLMGPVRGRSYELSTWYSMSTLYLVVSYHIPPPPLIYRLSSGWSYLWMFYDVLRCSIDHLHILLVTIVTGRLWRPMCIKVAAGDFRFPAF